MYDLHLSLDQYHFLMSLSGILCGFILCLFIFLVVSKI
nr:MAG TPA: HemY protein N-terminus [Inoviridae sp.]